MSENKDEEKQYYLLAVGVGKEKQVKDQLTAQLSGSGSMQTTNEQIVGIYASEDVRGYLLIVATDPYAVRHLMMHYRKVKGWLFPEKKGKMRIIGEISVEEANKYLQVKTGFERIDIGSIVVVNKGAFKGEKAIVLSMQPKINEITIELFEQHVPLLLHLSPKDCIIAN